MMTERRFCFLKNRNVLESAHGREARAFGLSQRLLDLPARLGERLAVHAAHYRTIVRRFVREGDLYR